MVMDAEVSPRGKRCFSGSHFEFTVELFHVAIHNLI